MHSLPGRLWYGFPKATNGDPGGFCGSLTRLGWVFHPPLCERRNLGSTPKVSSVVSGPSATRVPAQPPDFLDRVLVIRFSKIDSGDLRKDRAPLPYYRIKPGVYMVGNLAKMETGRFYRFFQMEYRRVMACGDRERNTGWKPSTFPWPTRRLLLVVWKGMPDNLNHFV